MLNDVNEKMADKYDKEFEHEINYENEKNEIVSKNIDNFKQMTQVKSR